MNHEACPRCHGDLGCWSGSYFTTQIICCQCKTEELQLPGFAAAQQAETDAVRGGNLNFPGVGLSAADLVAMRQLIAARKGANGGQANGG